jgi:hypothetical protein
VLAGAVLAIAIIAPLGSRLHTAGAPMEEAFMVLLPYRVAHGAVMYRDFRWLWGPGGLWLPAAVHAVFGWTMGVERAIGVAYGAVWAFAQWRLARRWSELAGLAAGLMVVLVSPSVDLPIYAAVPLALLAVLAASRVLEADARAANRWWPLVAGLLGGTALLFRPDLILGVALALGVITWGHRGAQVRVLLGAAVPLAVFLAYGLTAGLGRTLNNVVVMGLHVRAERHLPVPPHNHALLALFLLVIGSIVVVVACGIRRMIKTPASVEGRVLTAVGLFSVGLLGEMLQRADASHLALGVVAVGMLPAAVIDATRDVRVPRLTLAAVAVAVVGLVLAVATWSTYLRPYGRALLVTAGHRSNGTITVENRGRSFVYKTENAAQVRQVLARVEALARPGEHLFVGLDDMRRTPYNDDSIALLLPQLHDEMTFPDMHPRVALTKMSELTADIERSDVLVLTNAYDDWDEPNESRQLGPATANKEVATHFCAQGTYGPYKVLTRCR